MLALLVRNCLWRLKDWRNRHRDYGWTIKALIRLGDGKN
jgi:hypothetical protein